MECDAQFSMPEPWDRSAVPAARPLPSKGGVLTRTKARHQFMRRFLFSDLQPLTEVGTAPDPHPEGPSSIPTEAPADIRKELAIERRREGLRKAAVSTRLPRLTQAAASRDAFLKAAGHTAQGSQSLRICEQNALAKSFQDGDALSSILEAQRRDLWFDRAKAERDDLGRESRMLHEALDILRSHQDVDPSNISPGSDDSRNKNNIGVFRPKANTTLNEAPSSGKSFDIVSGNCGAQESRSSSCAQTSRDAVPESTGSAESLPGTPPPEEKEGSSGRTTESKIDEIYDRQFQVQQVAQAQDLLARAKKAAMDLMFLADKADQEASKEAGRLQDMQRAPSHSDEALFDSRVGQRRVWMAKNELALQSRLRYQEAVAELHRVQAEWGPTLGLEVSSRTSPRTTSSTTRTLPASSEEERGAFHQAEVLEGSASNSGGDAGVRSRTPVLDEMICLWVIGVIAVNISGETLSRAYYGSFSEADTVPPSGWMAFDEASTEISVSCVVPKQMRRKGTQKTVRTWVVDGSPFPEVNGRYMERGTYDGVPRYRNPNNIFLFRHTLSRSEELGITRQSCLPEGELQGEEAESSATTAELALGREISGRIGMDFSRLVKTSLQSINLDRQEKVRLNHERIARAEAKVDTQFQEQMSVASATLSEVETGGNGSGSVVSSAGGRTEQHRGLAIMAASESAKLTFQDNTSDGDRVIPCDEHGAAPLCKRWVARACPKNQINCRCRHYFISMPERDRMVAWREGKCARAELEVLACIAKRESLLSEAEKEGVACSRHFLSETRTVAEERDVASLLRLLDQLRLASVRVIEAICVWREERPATTRAKTTASRTTSGTRPPATRPQGSSTAANRKGGRSIEGGDERGGPHAPSHENSSVCPRATGGPPENNFSEDGFPGNSIDHGSSVNPMSSHSSVANQVGDHYDKACSNDVATGKRKAGKMSGAVAGDGRDCKDGGRGSGGRVAKGRWVATMMVPGRKLWDSSPAMMSQYKRHRRSRQDPKIARDQLCLGVFATKNEATEAYDDALCREAVKQRSSVLRMPKKRIVTRACGKHMAVQSDDTPPGRPCEQCAAEALNGGVKHSPPYIWNNSNYLLKMTEDLDFLAGVDPLVSWLAAGDSEGAAFELEGNPFSLAPSMEGEEEQGIIEGSETQSPDTSAPPIIMAGCEAQPVTPRATSNTANNNSASAPSTAPSSLAVSCSRQGNNEAEDEVSVMTASPHHQQQHQQRAWTTPARLSRFPGDDNENHNDHDQLGSAATSCAISAVTTPNAAWAEEGDSVPDGARWRGGSVADDTGVPASASRRIEGGAEAMLMRDRAENGLRTKPDSLVVRDPRYQGEGNVEGLGSGMVLNDAGLTRKPTRAAFGRPSTEVTRFSNGVQEWCGEAAKGGRFIIPFAPAFGETTRSHQEPRNSGRRQQQQLLVAEGVGPGFPPRQEVGVSVEVLDLGRVETALAILHEEQDIADAMSGKPPRQRPKHQLLPRVADGGGVGRGTRRGAGSSASEVPGCDSSATATTVPGRAEKSAGANHSVSSAGTRSAGGSGARGVQATPAAAAGDENGHAAGAAVGANMGRGRRMRDVLAVYRHRGAQLVLEQSRKRHPFRMSGVFCRQDRGEWAGQVHMSVNAKKFVARMLLDKVLERRNEQRGRIGRMMHKLIEQGQPIHRLAGPRLRVLLSKARGLGGDRLTIDIMEAEAALRLFGRVEKSATVIQETSRGTRLWRIPFSEGSIYRVGCRRARWNRFWVYVAVMLLRTLVLYFGLDFVQAFVRGVFGRKASKRFLAMRREEARLKSIAMTAAGAVAENFVTECSQRALRGAKRFIRRPVTASVGVFQDGRRMIVSALPLEQRGFGGGAPKATTEWHQLCSACQGRSARRVWSCKRNAEEIFRGVCSCGTVRPPESVQLTAYDPVTGEQVHMTVSGKMLTRYLSSRTATESADGQPAALSAPGTSAVSEARGHVTAAARLLPVPWDAALGYGNPRREAGTTMRCIWEPYHEAAAMEKVAENARYDRQQLFKASQLAKEAAAKASLAEETARVRHEVWQMKAEDVAGRRRNLVLKFLWESQQSREALAFSWRSVQQMEDRKAEDWTQSWDPFENGNNWRQLVRRRSTDRALCSSTKASLEARDFVYRTREDRAAWKQWAKEARVKLETVETAVNKASARVDSLSYQAKAARNSANEALKLLTVLSRPTVKAAGQLQKRLVIEDGGHDREQWDALFRGGMVLETPELSYIGAEESKRRFCVSTIRRDARTGTVSITAAGEDKAVNLYSVTMSAAEVMSVVSVKVGGRRGKELIAPIVMNGTYTAIRRVQEARRKEILQVFVKSLELDIYQNELAVGKLFFIRRTAELKSRLYESLWYRDAVARRSSGRGTEMLRQFRRLGRGWATVVVYETWGDLLFEAYDPATTCTVTLQASLREALQSLWPNRAATAAFLRAARTGNFPRKLLRQVLDRLDIVLPGEDGKWWRRPIDGDTPHLALLGGSFCDDVTGTPTNACGRQYRGPIWTEERYTSGKPVTARVLVSARGDFLVEMQSRDVNKRKRECNRGLCAGSEQVSQACAPCASGTNGGTETDDGEQVVVRLEVRAQELRVVFRALDMVQDRGDRSMESLLAPDQRAELCRYLVEHIALEDVRRSTTSADAKDDKREQQSGVIPQGSRPGTADSNVEEADIELREAYKLYKAWATAVKAPVDADPLRGIQHEEDRQKQRRSTESETLLSPSEFSLVFRPDIDSDEHLLPIHESPWTPDGQSWFQAKISLLQGRPPASATTTPGGPSWNNPTGTVDGRGRGNHSSSGGEHAMGDNNNTKSKGGVLQDQRLGESAGLAVTLRPEGAGQRRARLEREAVEAMAAEDERSRLVGGYTARLESEAAGRAAAVEENRRASRRAAAAFTARTRSENVVRALLQEEETLTKTWAERDLGSARQTALKILPLLRLETRRQSDGGQDQDLVTLQVMEGTPTTTTSSDGASRSDNCSRRQFRVLANSVQDQLTSPAAAPTGVTRSRSPVPGFYRSFEGRRGSAAKLTRDATKDGAGKGAERRAPRVVAGEAKEDRVEREIAPAPLRSARSYGDEMPAKFVASERRYRGESARERGIGGAGSISGSSAGAAHAAASAVMGKREVLSRCQDEDRPILLAQQVMRIEGTCGEGEGTDGADGCRTALMSAVAVVRVVLETRDAGCSCDRDQGSTNGGRCGVRGVIRVEAYLPDSSRTLAIRIKVPPTPAVATIKDETEGAASLTTSSGSNGVAEGTALAPEFAEIAAAGGHREKADGSISSGGNGANERGTTTQGEQQLFLREDGRWRELCRSRKQRRRALRKARIAEAERGLSETLSTVQKAKRLSDSATKEEDFDSKTGSSVRQHENNAFSMLLIRANVVVPVRRIHLGSGSWREAIGELVGCPNGQKLRTLNVGGPLVFALDPSCPAPFNVKAEKLLGISVRGDVVWVQARAEEQVLALLEADGQVTGSESDTVSKQGGDRGEKMAIVEQRGRRYDQAVNKAARRMLPALSRSFFRAAVNAEDVAAAEARSLLNRAWLSPTSEMFGSPFDGINAMNIRSPDVDGACAISCGDGTTSGGVHLRPWDVAKDLLKMHALACKIPGPACPVPCCHQSRAMTLNVDPDTRARDSPDADSGAACDADAALLRELDRCIMSYWQSKHVMRREARKREEGPLSQIDEGSRPGATTAYAASAATSGSDPGGDGVQSAAKRKQPSAAHARGGHSQHKHRLEATRPSRPSPSPRPYVQALEALERLTSAAGKPHDGVSSAVLSATAATTTAGDNFPQLLLSVSSPSSAGVIGSEVVEKGERASGEQQRPQSAVDSGREGAGRSGQGASMSSGGYRCRVGFDMIRLLTGPDANDAGGTPVGVRPGEDVEAAVLGGSGSKVSQWVVGRLKMEIGGDESSARRNTEEDQQALCLDNTHATGIVCISGTRFLLTIAQLLDGSVSVSGHDPLTCQTSALTLDSSAARALSLSEGLQIGPKGGPFGSVIAKHLVRHAARLLEVKVVDGVDTLSLTWYNRRDDDSLASSAASGAFAAGAGLESPAHSPPRRRKHPNDGDIHHSRGDSDDNDGGETKSPAAGSPTRDMTTETPRTVTADSVGLAACRIRRLEEGRRRAVGMRRAASIRRVAEVAKEQRELQLTCDAAALASATSSFRALLLSSSSIREERAATKEGSAMDDAPPVVTSGVSEEYVDALRRAVVQELSGGSNESLGRRGSVQKVVKTMRRGSVQVRRGSIQMVERALKRPGTPTGDGAGTGKDGAKDPPILPLAAGGGRREAGNDEDEVNPAKDGSAASSFPLREGGGGGLPLVGDREEEEGAPRYKGEETPGSTDGRGGDTAERQQEQLRRGSLADPEKTADERLRQKRPKTRSPRNNDGTGSGAAGASSTVSLEALLAAVADLSRTVEREGGSLGVAAFAAWWVRATSDAELELKEKFLNPAPRDRGGWRQLE